MSVVFKDESQGCRFEYPDDATVLKYYQKIYAWFESYLSLHSLSIASIQTNFNLLGDTIVRVIKRKDYYEVFHEGVQLNEAKEAALLAYWIIKYRPFSVVIEKSETVQANLRINEGFAAFIIFSSAINGGNLLSPAYVNTLMYAFQYWDLSKEAIMLIAETLYETNYVEEN
jgi:hypothetical protein